MNRTRAHVAAAFIAGLVGAVMAWAGMGCDSTDDSEPTGEAASPQVGGVTADALQMIQEGRHTFRFDTFGDEAFWGGQLHLDDAIAGRANGGVGRGLSPRAALALGFPIAAANGFFDVRREPDLITRSSPRSTSKPPPPWRS